MNDQQVMHAMDLDDAYHVERVLARGAGGATELVTLGGSGPFVRKRIPSKLARCGVWGTLAECDCERLPKVVASYEMPDEFVVICECVPGENLEQLVASRGRLAEKNARQLVIQLCEAAGALHARGIIHRDISPRNVIVAADGAHLIDLGIARFRSEGAAHDTTQLGTPGFASPEQHGFAQTDPRSDVYSIGCVLGYLLTGVMPDVPAADEYERALSDEKIVSPELAAVVRKASNMERSARYQSADELARALGGMGAARPPASQESVEAAASAAWKERAASGKRAGRRQISMVKVALCVAMLLSLIGAIALFVIDATSGDSGQPSDEDGAGGLVSTLPDLPGDEGDREDAGTAPDTAPSSGTQSTVVPSTDENPLEIVESGWSADSSGYVNYAVAIHNNGDVQIDLPGYTVTGRDADGQIVFSSEQYLSAVPAGGTVWFGEPIGNGTAPATVEFDLIGLKAHNMTNVEDRTPHFTISGVREISDNILGSSFVGEITCEREGESAIFGSDVALTLVLRDESGAVVYGDIGFVAMPEAGETTAFEIMVYELPEHASCEVYAQAW